MIAFIIRLLKTVHTFCIDLILLVFITSLFLIITTFQESSIYFLAYSVEVINKWLLSKVKLKPSDDNTISTNFSKFNVLESINWKQPTLIQKTHSLFNCVYILKTKSSLINPYFEYSSIKDSESFFNKNYFLPSYNLNLKYNYLYFENPNVFNYWSFVDSHTYFQLLQSSLQQLWSLNYSVASYNDLRLFSNLNSLFVLPIINNSTIKFFESNKLNFDFSKFNNFYGFLFRQFWFKKYSLTFKEHHRRINIPKIMGASTNFSQLSWYSLSSLSEYANLLNRPLNLFNGDIFNGDRLLVSSNYWSNSNFNLLLERSEFLTCFDFNFFSVLTPDPFHFDLIYLQKWWRRRWELGFFFRYYSFEWEWRPRINFFNK